MGVFKKGDRWYTDLYDSNGRRVRQVVKIENKDPSAITRKDALDVEAIRKADRATGVKLASKKKSISFEKLVEKYLEWANENHKSPSRDHSACKSLLSFFKDYKANNLNLFLVDKYKSYRKKSGVKPASVNRELTVLRRMYNLALKWNTLSDNPIIGLQLLKEQTREYRVLKDWEFELLYQSASEHFKPILLFAYMTGCRKGEIQKLKWTDIDLKERNVAIRDTKNFEDRIIPLNDTLYYMLEELKEESVSEFVFTYNNQPYLSDSAWGRSWRTALRKSGIDHARFHDIRHTFVSNLIVNHKEDFATVMALSGHKDISMLKRYSHTKEEAKFNAIKKLEANIFVNKSNSLKQNKIDLVSI